MPAGVKILGNQSLGNADITYIDFSEVNLKEMQKNCLKNNINLDNVDLSSCTEFTVLGAFQGCTNLKTINFSRCTKLATIWNSCFSGCTGLTGIMDLSSFTNLKKIMGGAFGGCTNLTVKLPSSITSIESAAFGNGSWPQYCMKVLVPNEDIKKLVKDSGYDESRIEVQP
ncbi:MAG: leucine-rich repeat protein [Treponema sp.]